MMAASDDRIHIYIPTEVFQQLERRLKPEQTMDQLIDEIMADETRWQAFQRKLSAGRPLANGTRMTAIGMTCTCCDPVCRIQFHWRGRVRCGCNPDRIAMLEGGQDLED